MTTEVLERPTKKAVDPTKATMHTITAPFKIETLTSKPQWLKFLVYGKHGNGKTTLAGSAADVKSMSDVLFIDCESGDMTLTDNSRIKNIDGIDVITCSTFKQVAQIHEFLKIHCNARDKEDLETLKKLQSKFTGVPVEDIKRVKQYKTVVIDSLTELDQLCMYQQLGISLDTKIDADIDVAQFAEFRKNNQMMQLLIRAYRDLPLHLLLVCSAQYVQDEQKRMHFTPNLTGKLSTQVQGFMDVVAYLTVGAIAEGQSEAARRLFIQPVGKFDAKNRRSQFKEAYIDNPTMETVMTSFGFNGQKKG